METNNSNKDELSHNESAVVFKQEEYIKYGTIIESFVTMNVKNNQKVLEQFISTPVTDGDLIGKYSFADKNYAFISYTPNDKNISILSVIALKKEGNQYETSTLALEGEEHPVTLKSITPDTEPYKGWFEIQMNENLQVPFPVSNPYFGLQVSKVKPEQQINMNLAGLSLGLEKTPEEALKISQGGMYEVALKEFLETHPNKTKADFPYVLISLEHFHGLLPGKYHDTAEYQGDITELKELNFIDYQVYHLKVMVWEDGFCLDIYAPKNAFEDKNYIPKVGDNIRGVMWLTGQLTEKSKI